MRFNTRHENAGGTKRLNNSNRLPFILVLRDVWGGVVWCGIYTTTPTKLLYTLPEKLER